MTDLLKKFSPPPRKFLDWRHWLRGLWIAVIQGGCTAFLGSLGMAAGWTIGMDIQPLDFHQAGAVFLAAACVHGAIYLKQNPVPEEREYPEAPDQPSS